MTDEPATGATQAPDRSYMSRIDLMQHPAFSALSADSDGRPCVWENHYRCDADCENEWEDTWSCQCDDRCSVCNTPHEPEDSHWIGPVDPQLIALWESLPEDPPEPLDAAQRHHREQEALTGSETS